MFLILLPTFIEDKCNNTTYFQKEKGEFKGEERDFFGKSTIVGSLWAVVASVAMAAKTVWLKSYVVMVVFLYFGLGRRALGSHNVSYWTGRWIGHRSESVCLWILHKYSCRNFYGVMCCRECLPPSEFSPHSVRCHGRIPDCYFLYCILTDFTSPSYPLLRPARYYSTRNGKSMEGGKKVPEHLSTSLVP